LARSGALAARLTIVDKTVKFTIMSENLLKYRHLEPRLPNSRKRRIVVITGARQTGKTTLVKKKYADLNYINLDAPENRETLKEVPTVSWGEAVGAAVIDEAQKEPAVFEKVKYAFDENDIRFAVLTGSSQVLLLKKIRESLAGRAFFYELWPMMQCEILGGGAEKRPPLLASLFGPGKIDDVLASVSPVKLEKIDVFYRRAESHMLAWGGMPALLPMEDEERREWLKNYNYTYLERDLADLARLDDLTPFRKFQRLSALRSGNLLNYSELARDAGVSVDTARRYLEYLKLSYQVALLQPYGKNITSSTVKTPKIYYTDIGVLRTLTGFRGPADGGIYETMVVGECVKWTKTSGADSTLYFYRTRSGMVVDLLVENQDGLLGMEIKYREKTSPGDIGAMARMAEKLGDKWRGGIVVHSGRKIEKIASPGIWAVPSRRLFQAP
jgi:predicted AAA+ superfamily ATPase